MRLITRCPACGTLFKVVPDQLRISEGWVRCGHCSNVFDATAHFHDPDAEPPQAQEPQPVPQEQYEPQAFEAVQEPQEPHFPQEPQEPTLQPEWNPQLSDQGFQSFQPDETPGEGAANASEVAETAPLSDFPENPFVDTGSDFSASNGVSSDESSFLDAPATPIESDELIESYAADPSLELPVDPVNAAFAPALSAQVPELDPANDGLVEDAVTAAVAAPANDVDDNASDRTDALGGELSPDATPTFVRQADRRAFWRRPLVRVLLAFLLLVAAGALLLQVSFTQRERIAAYMPAARPWLVQMCVALKCEMGALRQIESVLVDGSSFTRLRTDTYRLGIVLKNSAQVEIAMPNVELELSSVQGRTLVRRVLTPSDMGAASTLAPGAEWIGEIPIVLDASDVASRVAGYAVLPFYP